jgi:G3E family GTPase
MPQDSRPPAFPLTIVTGFLGAGKTTFLNRTLRDPALADALVIVNEFGEIGLDHLLMEGSEDGMILMSSGCLCCTIRGDLVTTLEDLLRRRDNGRIAPFGRVMIETTGLADPAPIIQAILHHPYLIQRFPLAGIVTLIDAVNGMATLDAHIEAVKQAAVADRLLISKRDLATLPDIAALEARLHQLNPGAIIVSAGDADGHIFDGLTLYDPTGKSPDVAAWLRAEAYPAAGQHDHAHDDHGHAHDHHGHTHRHDHAHDVNRHDASIRAFCLSADRPIGASAFENFLDLLRSAHGPKLLRVKGIIALADDTGRPLVIHGVQSVFHPPMRLAAWPDGDRRSRLVFIVRDLDEAFVARLWNAFLGEPAIDRPDAAAITDNPLAPPTLRSA